MTSTAKLSALGFCGADDSVNPRLLALIGQNYPLVEFGVLFRPDKEGQPRYATKNWVSNLSNILSKNSNTKVRLAAHLCGSYVNDFLSYGANDSAKETIDLFLKQLHDWGFRRVQVNATAVNGVFTENLADDLTIHSFLSAVRSYPELEFIVQKNEETSPLWSGLLKAKDMPENMVFLHDESKGTGKEVAEGWPTDPTFVAPSKKIVGFAGGIKPSNVKSVVQDTLEASSKSGACEFWIDMESGVRTTLINHDKGCTETKDDVFDLAKCYNVIDIVCELGLMEHPTELR